MTMPNILRGALPAAALAVVLGGCVTTVTKDFPTGLYPAAPTDSPKAGGCVAVVLAPGAPAQVSQSVERGFGGGVVRLQSYPQTVADMLSTVYEKAEVVNTEADAKGADLLAYMSAAFPKSVDLTIKESGAGGRTFSFSVPGVSPYQGVDVMAYIVFPLSYPISSTSGNQARVAAELAKSLEELIPRALGDIRERILANDALLNPPAKRALIAKHEAAGDFARAAVEAYPGSETALRLQAKVAAAGQVGQPSDAARALMARGKAAIALAVDQGGFRQSALYMEQALTLAPGWATGHFNAGLAQEGASDWGRAGKHFEMYLKLKPDADDKEKVFQKIAELSVRQANQKR